MIVDSVRNFIKTCPCLSEFRKGIGVDNLGEDATCYVVESVPCDPVLKKYANGDSQRQYLFIFGSRESYGQDVMQNLENINFYEKFSSWLEEQCFNGTLPVMDSGQEALKIEAITTGYAFDTDVDKARYQIQCRLKYYQNFKGGL